jgi:hypothetical protein
VDSSSTARDDGARDVPRFLTDMESFALRPGSQMPVALTLGTTRSARPDFDFGFAAAGGVNATAVSSTTSPAAVHARTILNLQPLTGHVSAGSRNS